MFAAVLDRANGGRFALRPVEPFRTERRYVDDTNVLETDYVTQTGRVRVTDLMTLTGPGDGGLQAERELLRVAEGVAGEVEMEVDGLSSREGAFGISAFWAVELLAQQGRTEEAEALFCHAAGLANDVGLLAEEYDPATRAALGNVPQAFSHAGLISAALTLEGVA